MREMRSLSFSPGLAVSAWVFAGPGFTPLAVIERDAGTIAATPSVKINAAIFFP